MTCQRCRAEATVHLTEKVDGLPREVHLCAQCAHRAGLVGHAPPPASGLDAAIQALITQHVGELVGTLARTACPDCGLRFMEFRVNGRLGCPSDYGTFTPGLVPLLKRAHGATRHVGKVPTRRPGPDNRLRLRAQLRDAISREDYEAAALLRDRLRQKDTDA
jgi:protein arginine kinase activator